jgi:opacity protein-like surface antigen
MVACIAKAQVIKYPVSVTYSGLEAYSSNFSDIFSAATNEASLAKKKTGGFGVYGERRFLLQELNNYAAVVAIPTSSGVFGVEGDYFGSPALNETELGMIYARKVGRRIDVGAKFNRYTVRIPGYGSASSINFEAGVMLRLSDKLTTGIHAYNPGGSKLGKNGQEKLASVYRCGIGYEVSEMLFAGAEIVKQENQGISVNAGFQYNLQKNIFIRTAISTLTDNSYAALGFQLSFARIDINAAYHPQLGFTPGLLLLFNLKEKGTN